MSDIDDTRELMKDQAKKAKVLSDSIRKKLIDSENKEENKEDSVVSDILKSDSKSKKKTKEYKVRLPKYRPLFSSPCWAHDISISQKGT